VTQPGSSASPAVVLITSRSTGGKYYVHNITGDFGVAAVRSVANVALQPRMGLLSQRRSGPCPGDLDHLTARSAGISQRLHGRVGSYLERGGELASLYFLAWRLNSWLPIGVYKSRCNR
jgi:hypothetical protein